MCTQDMTMNTITGATVHTRPMQLVTGPLDLCERIRDALVERLDALLADDAASDEDGPTLIPEVTVEPIGTGADAWAVLVG